MSISEVVDESEGSDVAYMGTCEDIEDLGVPFFDRTDGWNLLLSLLFLSLVFFFHGHLVDGILQPPFTHRSCDHWNKDTAEEDASCLGFMWVVFLF